MQNVRADNLSEELDLLDDEEPKSAGEGLPRDTVYVEVWGRMFKVHAELTSDTPTEYLTFPELEYFISAREEFKPRNAVQEWLHSYLATAAESGVERSDVMNEAAAQGFGPKTVERAFKAIEAHSHRQGFRQPARWYRDESLCHKLH